MKMYSLVLAAMLLPAAVSGNNIAAKAAKPAVKAAKPAVENADLKFKFDCKVNKPDGIYKKGEEVVLSGKVVELSAVPKAKFYRAQLLFNDKNKENRVLPITEEVTFKVSSKVPGWFVLRLTALDENKKQIINYASRGNWKPPFFGGIGAMVAPEELMPGTPEPADFDEFWKKQRAELDKVPVKATRKSVDVPKWAKGKVLCWDVKVDCAGGMPVSGYLCMPPNAKPKSLPAMVSYHGAGVRSANKPAHYGQRAIAFDVNAHGIENGHPKAFYDKLSANELKAYQARNKEDRDKFYFRGMFLRIMRALDYVKTLPEWNGKILIVTGGSQGGAQALVAAALDPQVTYCGANVPALCDHGGSFADRAPGWPRLYNVSNKKVPYQKTAEAVKYYDVSYFAKRIKCETRVSTGFFDTVCVPTSVYAAYNSIPAATKKALYTEPAGTHSMPHAPSWKRVNEIISGK